MLSRQSDFIRIGIAAALLCSSMLMLPVPASAQTIHQALTQAYRSNPQLDAARATQRATDEEVARANSGYRPTITGSANASWTRTDTRPPSSNAGETHPRSLGVDLSQPIFSGFRTLNQVRVAEATVRAGRETLRTVEQTVLLAAATAYMDVVRDEAIVRLAENNVNVLSNQLKATQDQFSVGEVTRTDVAQAQARRAGAVSQLEVARADLKNSRANYERVVGSPPGRLREAGEPRGMPRSLPAAKSIAARENPFVVNALYLEQAARYVVEQIRGELLPTITLNASYNRNFDPSRQIDQSDSRSVSANMSVPIYSNGEVEARVRQAKQTHVSRIQQIEQVRNEQENLVVTAWSQYEAAKAVVVSAAESTRANQTALTGVREEYRVGQRTLLDVLNAEQELLTAQVSEVRAQHDVVVQAYTLLQAVGRLNAQEMGLGAEIYDAEIHYFEVRRKWFGLSITHSDGRREVVDSAWKGVTHRPMKVGSPKASRSSTAR
ncbi:MAG: TolC family outer membrane protein [Hyphomicrobiaceae bacterium]